MDMFETSTETKKIGKIIVLNAEGGVGKTTIMGQAILEAGEKGLIVSCGEDGITPLKNDKQHVDLTGINHLKAVINKWSYSTAEKEIMADDETYQAKPGLLEVMRHIVKQGYTDVGFDSLTCIMPVLRQYCLQTYYFDDATAHGKAQSGGVKSESELIVKAEGFGGSELIGYQSKEWDKFLAAIQYLREQGVNVYITTHRATKKGKIVGEDMEFDYNFVKMDITKNFDLGGNLYDISDAFLYGKFDVEIAQGKGGKGKAVGGDNRVFITNSTPAIKAKNRFGMDNEIPATWEAIRKYIK